MSSIILEPDDSLPEVSSAFRQSGGSWWRQKIRKNKRRNEKNLNKKSFLPCMQFYSSGNRFWHRASRPEWEERLTAESISEQCRWAKPLALVQADQWSLESQWVLQRSQLEFRGTDRGTIHTINSLGTKYTNHIMLFIYKYYYIHIHLPYMDIMIKVAVTTHPNSKSPDLCCAAHTDLRRWPLSWSQVSLDMTFHLHLCILNSYLQPRQLLT